MNLRQQLGGTPASGGVAVGPIYVLRAEVVRAEPAPATDPSAELARLDQALARAAAELRAIRMHTAARVGESEAQVFDAHLLFLEDPTLLDPIREAITAGRVRAEWAVQAQADELAGMLAALDDEYLAERAADVRDVGARVVRILMGRPAPSLVGLSQPSIVVANDLSPSMTAQMDRDLVLGFATDVGGPTSHTAIMARSLGIPAVVGLGDASARARHGSLAILDGTAGTLTCNPDHDEVGRAQTLVRELKAQQERQQAAGRLPSVTADGHRLELSANIGTPEEAGLALDWGADGVGLFRTEFLYMDRGTLPGEDEQYQAYRAALETMHPRPVIIRTLDIGGDKQLEALALPREANPFLGLRALRLCLHRPDLFKTQLRALLRASAHGHLRIMYPMVQGLGEVQAANAVLARAREELAAEGRPMGRPEVGIMVEIPAAAVIADLLAPHVDFFSIGTNDLAQYGLAVDRMNERVSHLYEPFHPALLRLIHTTCTAARSAGKWTGMCGEMAGDPVAAPVLLGLGLDEWSMSPPALPAVKEVLRHTRRADAVALARELMALADPAEIRQRAGAFYQGRIRQRESGVG